MEVRIPSPHLRRLRPAAQARSGLVRWPIEHGKPRFHSLRRPSNARDANLQTQSFATSTTIALHSLATFARPVGAIGQEEVH